MDTLMLQANLGTFREREIDRRYLDALENYKSKRPGKMLSYQSGFVFENEFFLFLSKKT